MTPAELWWDAIYYWLDLSDEEEAMCRRLELKCTPASMIDAIREIREQAEMEEDWREDGEDYSRFGQYQQHSTYHAVGGRVS